MHNVSKQINQKITWIVYAVLCCTTVIGIKLFLLQIILNPLLLEKSKKNFIRIEAIDCKRGNITDRNNTLLATNRPVIDVYWNGTGNYRVRDTQKQTIAQIEKLLSITILQNNSVPSHITHAERHRKKTRIATDITFEQLAQLEEQFPNNGNIGTKSRFIRYYPYQSTACHILGYLGRAEHAGKMGLEKMLEEQLQGQQGALLQTTDSVGRKISETSVNNARSGQTITTTLDIELQQIVESIFPGQYTGAIVVMDPKDGDILALSSRPNFDPTLFLAPILRSDWETLQENYPFINRAFSACYPPGSIFKLITASAALEHNVITPETTWNCPGYKYFGNRKYWCHKRQGHGMLTARKALEQSCNVVFYEIGRHISVNILANYAKQFGLGLATDVLFPEKVGLVPTTEWKLKVKGERWYKGETLSTAIGQSFLLVTPIQIARMISSIFTGYLTRPRILVTEPIEQTVLQIKPETLSFLRDSMQKVVKSGTGQHVNKIEDMKVFAKTSTAQTSDLEKRYLGRKYKEHGLFVAYFQYKNLNPMTIVILIEHAGAARVATRIAKQFLLRYKRLIDSSTHVTLIRT